MSRRLIGSPGAHFRQSQGQHATPLIRQLASRAGYRVCLSYDVDSRDWIDPGPAAIRAAVAAGVRPGSVVSMHLGHPGTLAALPAILADLDRRGPAGGHRQRAAPGLTAPGGCRAAGRS